MVSAPFDNEQYRNQGNKATEKRNCYQKVIICLRKFPPLFFVYCSAISALPGASSLFIARQILNRLLCRLFVFISVKVKPFLAYTSSTCFLISGLMRKRNISVLGAVTMFSTSDSSSLDCFLGHSISDDIKKAKRDVATLLLHLAWLCLQRKFESGGKILNQASCDKGRSRSAHGYRCCQAQIPMR